MPLQGLPDPDTIRRTAEEVMQRPAFQPDASVNADIFLLRIMLIVLEFLAWIFNALFKLVEGLPVVLQWIVVIGMVLIAVGLTAHIIYTIAYLFVGLRPKSHVTIKTQRKDIDPAELAQQADEVAQRGDCGLAIRLLFRACLLNLERLASRKLPHGTTNREVLRKHRNSPAYQPIKLFVEIIENKWYGCGECSREDFMACREAYAELQALKAPPSESPSPKRDLQLEDRLRTASLPSRSAKSSTSR